MKKSLGLFFVATMSANFVSGEILLPDPAIFCDNGVYYLTGTGNDDNGAFPVYKSTNLSDWESMGNALPLSQANGDRFFWAPQILKKDGRYVLAYCSSIETDKGRKHFMSAAESDKPQGKFAKSKVLTSDERVEIDPFIFTDDDGSTYIYYSRGNGNGICGRELTQSLDDKKLGYRTLIKNDRPWEGKVMSPLYRELNKDIPAKSDKFNCNKITVEGPTVLKRGGKYVMFYSANDFRSPDYCIGVAVADSPLGEFKKVQDYPIISREITGFNGSGHGDVFFDKNGEMWYVFHVHHSNIRVSPRRTAVIKLVETFDSDGIPHYKALYDTMKLL